MDIYILLPVLQSKINEQPNKRINHADHLILNPRKIWIDVTPLAGLLQVKLIFMAQWRFCLHNKQAK